MVFANRNNFYSLGLIAGMLAWLCLSGCSPAAENQRETVDPATLPQGDLADSSFLIVYDLYALEGSIDTAAVMKAFRGAFPELPLWDSIPKEVTTGGLIANYFPDAQTDFPPGGEEFLGFAAKRLDPAQRESLMKARDCISLGVVGTAADRWSFNHRFCTFLGDFVNGKPLVIMDEACREYDTPASWQERKLEPWKGEQPTMALHIVQHAYREEDGFCRIVSLGMEKFGLPNIVINDAVCSSQQSLSRLINLIAQTLAENSTLSKPGELPLDIEALRDTTARNLLLATLGDSAFRKGVAHLRFGKPEEGDSPGPLIEVYTYDPQFPNQQEYQDDLLTRIFGTGDTVIYTRHGDAELQAASERAREQLPRIQKKFNQGLGPEEVLLVKLPFETDEGGTEYMWVEVVEWKGDEIKGLLTNDPDHIADLKAGAAVSADADDVFDYLLQGPDGDEGNETSKVIEGMQ